MVQTMKHPWRWKREGCNGELGAWLNEMRDELQTHGNIEIAVDAPVRWAAHAGNDAESWAVACRDLRAHGGSAVAVLNWPRQCAELSRRLGGRWPVVERFDDPEMLTLAVALAAATGPEAVGLLHEFFAPRMTHVSTELRGIVEAITEGRPTNRFKSHPDHLARLRALATTASPESALAVIDGILAERDWRLYRQECVYQLRSALRECGGRSLADLAEAASDARTRARHRGRLSPRRSVGTPLLVKGLEFDHAALLWEPEHFTVEGLYVALTRASKSLTIVSKTRRLQAAC